MKVSEFRDILDQLAATQSTNEKESIIASIDNNHAIAFLSGSKYDDAGLGKKTVLAAAREVYDVDGEPTVSESLKEHDAPIDSSKDLHHLARDMDYLREASGNAMSQYLEGMFEDYMQPSVVAHACLDDAPISTGDSTIASALGVKDSLPFYDGVHAIAEADSPLTGPEVGRPFEPMLAVPESRGQPDNPVSQRKIDGYRMLIHVSDGEATAFTRSLNDETQSLPELGEIDWPQGDYVLDGEVIAENGSYSDTSERIGRKAENVERDVEMHFAFFDLLVKDGVDITSKQLGLRHMGLVSVVEQIGDDRLFVPTLRSNVEQAKDDALEAGDEGIIVKDLYSEYEFKRSSSWQKVKLDSDNIDVVVTDFHEGSGSATGTLGAVSIESADGVPLGKSGSGFSDEQRDTIWSNRDDWRGRTIEVEARGLGTHGNLRMPIFVRDRSDDGEPDDFDRITEIMKDV